MTQTKRRPPSEPEEDLQRGVMDYLALHGVDSLATNWAKAGTAADKGVPDLLCRRMRPKPWPDCVVLPIEIKTERGKPTPEQTTCIENGWYPIVRTMEGALECVREFEIERRLLA